MANGFGSTDLSGLEILVVDDDVDVLAAYAELFQLLGARVSTAASGNAGWRCFESTRPDVLISDIQMADGNGYELVERVRSLPAGAGGLTPAIAVSAEGSAKQSLEAGFDAYLAKPVDPLSLVDLVRSFVHEGARSRAHWTLAEPASDCVVLAFVGHPTADDMRAATHALAKVLETSARHVVVDLRAITGFELSVGNVAEREMWSVRDHITGATIVGGSFGARLVAKAACAVLGTSCELVDRWNPEVRV